MREAIPSLTGLRFVAALCVVLSHAIPKIVPFQNPPKFVEILSSLSAEGMSLFFVLSGFVIYYNYSHTIRSVGGLYNFFVARFARLYPLYFVGVSYDLLMKLSYDQLPSAKLAALPYYATLTQAWVYHPIGDNALIYQFGLIPQVAWSISTEWFFYLAFPLASVAILSLHSVGKRFWAAAMLSLAAFAILTALILNDAAITNYGVDTFGPVANIAQDSFYRWLMYFSPYVRLFEFLLGCLCASIFVKLGTLSAAEERFGAWLTAAALLTVAMLHWLIFGTMSNAIWFHVVRGLAKNFCFAVPLAILIFCCARYRNMFSWLMAKPSLVLCGEASYSLYLLHLIIINAFRYEAPVVNLPRVAIGAALQLVIVIMASIGLSFITWFTIEVPARRWIRRIMSVSVPRAAAEIKIAM